MKWWGWVLLATGGVVAVTVFKISAAIAHVESSGNYNALGPLQSNGDRAYGKYQIMGANIPQWSMDVLGVELSPDQFLTDPNVQDQIARVKIAELVVKYLGSVQDVASVWFSGQPYAVAVNRSDSTGTSVADYVRRVEAAL